jgi:hypothetical protein
MPAPKGNQFWKMRSSHGRNPIFQDAEQLWDACQQYFQWVEDNPLLEEKVFHTAGTITTHDSNKMRAMTIGGLCIFIGISQQAWSGYRQKEGFVEVITRVEEIIRTQKFEGAAAELLNPNIIARDLGLRDAKEFTGAGGGPIENKWTVEIIKDADNSTTNKT